MLIFLINKEVLYMKIAVPYDRGRIDPHFGHCQNMLIFDTDDEKILGKMM